MENSDNLLNKRALFKDNCWAFLYLYYWWCFNGGIFAQVNNSTYINIARNTTVIFKANVRDSKLWMITMQQVTKWKSVEKSYRLKETNHCEMVPFSKSLVGKPHIALCVLLPCLIVRNPELSQLKEEQESHLECPCLSLPSSPIFPLAPFLPSLHSFHTLLPFSPFYSNTGKVTAVPQQDNPTLRLFMCIFF